MKLRSIQKNRDCIPGSALGPGTQQQAPNIPAPKELKLESRLLQKEAFGICYLFLYLREYLGDSS